MRLRRSMLWLKNELPRKNTKPTKARDALPRKSTKEGKRGRVRSCPLGPLCSLVANEMKTLYLDVFSGISGDMLLGALIDLGVDAHQLEHELEKLRLDGYHLHVLRAKKSSIEGVKFEVHLEHEHSHEHAHVHNATSHAHAHTDTHGHSHHAQGHEQEHD